MSEVGQDIRWFENWRISRGQKRRDSSQQWLAVRGQVALLEDTWPKLENRIQERRVYDAN
jgi:hypothetical protein